MNTIKIEYAYVDGMHFFVSGDPNSKGVLVGHEDIETAFNEVSIQLEYILEKNQGIKSKCFPADTFESFSKWLTGVLGVQHGSITTLPSAVIDWTQNQAA